MNPRTTKRLLSRPLATLSSIADGGEGRGEEVLSFIESAGSSICGSWKGAVISYSKEYAVLERAPFPGICGWLHPLPQFLERFGHGGKELARAVAL